jgi:hypothetical protein
MARKREDRQHFIDYWMKHPDGTHDDALAYVQRNCDEETDIQRSYQIYHELSHPGDGSVSKLTIARRVRTRKKNARKNGKKSHPRKKPATELTLTDADREGSAPVEMAAGDTSVLSDQAGRLLDGQYRVSTILGNGSKTADLLIQVQEEFVDFQRRLDELDAAMERFLSTESA